MREVAVGRRGSKSERGVPDRFPQRGRQAGRGRDLDQLLVASLEAAVPIAEMDDCPAHVAGDLDLDVTDRRQQLLDEDTVVVEGSPGLGHCPAVRVLEFVRGGHDPHAAAAAAADRLDQHRGARGQVVHEGAGLFDGHPLGNPVDDRNAVLLGESPGPAPWSPNSSRDAGCGPTNRRPAAIQARAKPAFSLRKP